MTLRCTAFIATSLDGFIARPDGGLDWLDEANATVTPGEDCGYVAYMESVDAIVMGRNTFEKVLGFTPWPYDKKVYVLSRSWTTLPEGAPASATLVTGSLTALLAQAALDGHHSLYIDGGLAVQSFIAAGLLDEITITRIPVLLGAGLPLFGALPTSQAGGRQRLLHQETRSYPFGFVQSRYQLLQEN